MTTERTGRAAATERWARAAEAKRARGLVQRHVWLDQDDLARVERLADRRRASGDDPGLSACIKEALKGWVSQ